MVLVYLRTGDCIEVRDAASAERRNDSLICLDAKGRAAATFLASDVETYTANEELATAIKNEVCEDLTVVADDEKASEPEPNRA